MNAKDLSRLKNKAHQIVDLHNVVKPFLDETTICHLNICKASEVFFTRYKSWYRVEQEMDRQLKLLGDFLQGS